MQLQWTWYAFSLPSIMTVWPRITGRPTLHDDQYARSAQISRCFSGQDSWGATGCKLWGADQLPLSSISHLACVLEMWVRVAGTSIPAQQTAACQNLPSRYRTAWC